MDLHVSTDDWCTSLFPKIETTPSPSDFFSLYMFDMFFPAYSWISLHYIIKSLLTNYYVFNS